MTGLFPAIEPYKHGMLAAGDGNLVYGETCGTTSATTRGWRTVTCWPARALWPISPA